MRPTLFDTSVYIAEFRKGDSNVLALRWLGPKTPVWLSVVVLQELYAGASDGSRSFLERLESDFERIGRLLVPNRKDWSETGRLLNRLGTKYDYEEIGRTRLTNDALIAVSAGRSGITVTTTNARDFHRLAQFHKFSWRVMGAAES